jgi:uncharacterized membrane protein YuzA (DUF378 family)
MKAMNMITLVLIIIAGINWGLVGLFDYNPVVALLGSQDAALSRTVYLLMGVAALWQLYLLFSALQAGEVRGNRFRA